MASPPQLRVALDATPLLGARTGVGEFCLGALRWLSRREDMDVGAFAVSWRRRRGVAGALPPSVRPLLRPMPARPLHLAWRRGGLPPIEWFTGAVDVVHGTNFVVPPARHAARVVTVHDLTTLRYPELCHPATLGFPAQVRRAAAQGAWVHVPSEMVAGEVVELLGVDAERVRTVHHGVPTLPEDERPDRLSGEALPEDERPDRLWGDPLPGESRPEELPGWVERYVLALGTVEPRKDLPSLVRAFGELAAARRGLALVIAGPDGWGSARLEQAIAEAPCPQRVVRLGWVQPAARRRLLAGAAVFGYPSVYEGFGFPPLEAMAAGVPVVATRAGSLPEVLGDGACLVEVGDVDSLAAALAGLLDDESAARSARERGWERTRRFCWRGCSEGLALLYRDAVAGAA